MGEAEPHPDWKGGLPSGYDFALIKLNESSTIQFITPADEDLELTAGDSLAAMGWGRLSARSAFQRSLQVANDIPFIPVDVCSASSTRTVDDLLCAGDGRAAPCAGDQGGPLIRSSPNSDPSEDVLVGIATAMQSVRTATCAEFGVPGLYVSIKLVSPWIKSKLGSK